MDIALDAVLELFTWTGFGGAVILGIVLVVLWAVDGTWLAEAIVDRDGDEVVVRWFDGDGDANSARPTDAARPPSATPTPRRSGTGSAGTIAVRRAGSPRAAAHRLARRGTRGARRRVDGRVGGAAVRARLTARGRSGVDVGGGA